MNIPFINNDNDDGENEQDDETTVMVKYEQEVTLTAEHRVHKVHYVDGSTETFTHSFGHGRYHGWNVRDEDGVRYYKKIIKCDVHGRGRWEQTGEIVLANVRKFETVDEYETTYTNSRTETEIKPVSELDADEIEQIVQIDGQSVRQ